MATKKSVPVKPKRRESTTKRTYPFHRLDALVSTIRCISRHEDTLCELSLELKRTGGVSEECFDELREILEKIPSEDYLLDLEAVREIFSRPLQAATKASKASKEIDGRNARAPKTGRKPSK